MVGQEGLAVLWGEGTFGAKGCVSGPEVRVMPRTWAGGAKSKQERRASLQAHGHSCKREGVSRQLPSGLSQKGVLRGEGLGMHSSKVWL